MISGAGPHRSCVLALSKRLNRYAAGGMVGPEEANQMGRDKACRGGKPVEKWSSLTYVEKKLFESQSHSLKN